METIDDFFELVNNKLKSEKFKDCSFPVFRGHSQSSYELLPTLHRVFGKTGKSLWTLENNLYSDFKALVGPRVKFQTSWEALFAMRHEGIPTRLIDWTENIGTAIFFALDSDSLAEPHLWVLNPYGLNEKNKHGEVLIDPEVDLPDYQNSFVEYCNNQTIEIEDLPVAIYPRRSNDRILAQRGLFTIHGKNESKMEDTCFDFLEKIVISAGIVDKLKDLLIRFGINKYSVYPDLKGLAEYLQTTYKY